MTRRTMIAAAWVIAGAATGAHAQATTQPVVDGAGPYKVVKSARVGGEGGFDYVCADAASRHFFVIRSARPSGKLEAYDLDTLAPAGSIEGVVGGHGTAVDAASGHGFVSSNPVVMFDAKTVTQIKTIPVTGRPDAIFSDAASGHVFVLSHSAPNATILNAADGAVLGTLDLGGEPEQGVSDGLGHAYICLENKDAIAVVDTKANKLIATYDMAGKCGGPAGLAIDVKNNLLFAFGHEPANCAVLNAADGKILGTLPIGNGVDSASFNPDTLEAFSSQGDGTLTVVKETSPTEFTVEQTVHTKPGARCSTLDAKTGQIYLPSIDRAPASQPATAGETRGRGGPPVPGSFTITVVGK